MSVESLGELIRLAIDAHAQGVHTTIPGIIKVYDPLTLRVKVQPAITQPVETEDDPLFQFMYETQPILHDVPVAFPRGGGTSITWPLSIGDAVLVVFSESDLSQWLTTGSVSNPDQIKRHGLSGGIAIPCIGADTSPLPSTLDSGFVITADSIKLGSMMATDFVALAALVLAELGNIATALTTHKHTGVTTGPGVTGVSDSTYSPSSVAATKVKAI